MPVINRTALVMYSAEQMYNLVNDVIKYPEFLNGCTQVDILEQSDTHMVARLHLKKSGFNYQLVTRNQLQAPVLIELNLEQGPLSHLTGAWQFTPLRKDACKVEMNLDFAAQGFTGKTLGHLLAHFAATMVESFCLRAEQIYKHT